MALICLAASWVMASTILLTRPCVLSYIGADEGWLYLTVVIDLVSR